MDDEQKIERYKQRLAANITIVRGMRIAEVLGMSLDFLATGNEKPYTCPFCKGSGVL